jgi:pimeloyl-ACP methyl ester carboxylesterase
MTTGRLLTLSLRSGLKINAMEWGSGSKKVLCSHGWLDNIASFGRLGPFLADKGFHVVAWDNVGHGHSAHLGSDSKNPYTVVHYVGHLRDCVDALGWGGSPSSFVGHSLGAMLSFIFAATFPERVASLALIDGFTPMTSPASAAAKNLRRALDAIAVYDEKRASGKERKAYPSLDAAVAARLDAVKNFPGNQTLSMEAATAIVAGGTSATADGAVFRHDGRLVLPNYLNMTNEQVRNFVECVAAPVLLVQAETGWPNSVNDVNYQEYRQMLTAKGLLQHVTLPGSHHLHVDPSSADLVAETVARFLLTSNAAPQGVAGKAAPPLPMPPGAY